MSRTNHYRIWSKYDHNYIPEREVLGRRNWFRRAGYSKYGPKSYHNPPPRWWWQEQHARVRQIYKQMMIREEDPALPSDKKIINLWGWY